MCRHYNGDTYVRIRVLLAAKVNDVTQGPLAKRRARYGRKVRPGDMAAVGTGVLPSHVRHRLDVDVGAVKVIYQPAPAPAPLDVAPPAVGAPCKDVPGLPD